MIAFPVALLLAVADPCEPPEPGVDEPATAAAYVEVAEAELAAGARGSAAAAFREALRRDPSSARALAGLAAACEEPGDDVVARAAALARAGDVDGALDTLAGARRLRSDGAAALLEGALRLRSGSHERARAALERALLDPATVDAARLLLAVVARRAGDGERARAFLERAAASSDRRVGVAAARLLGSSRRDGRAALAAYVGSSWDSNALLAPDLAGMPLEDTADAAATAAVTLQIRPFGASGPFATGGAEHRRHRRLAEFDLAGWFAGGGLRFSSPRGSAAAEYRRRVLGMGGAAYSSAHAGRIELRLVPWRRLLLSLSADLEETRYVPEYARGFGGTRAGGELRAAWVGAHAWGAVAWRGAIHAARDPAFSHVEHGPAIDAGLAPTRRLRLSVEGVAAIRRSDTGSARDEVALEATLAGEVTIAAGLAARGALGARRTFAELPELTRRKGVASLGLVWEAAWP